MQMSTCGEVTECPEVQRNIPQLCGCPPHNHSPLEMCSVSSLGGPDRAQQRHQSGCMRTRGGDNGAASDVKANRREIIHFYIKGEEHRKERGKDTQTPERKLYI